jgi:hypothetical protein
MVVDSPRTGIAHLAVPTPFSCEIQRTYSQLSESVFQNCSAESCHVCGAHWENCTCSIWGERNLLNRAEQVC